MATLQVRTRDRTWAMALVDDEDLERLDRFSWHTEKAGYVSRIEATGGNKRVFFLHREVVGATHGDGVVVRHANGNRLDNRRANLVVMPGRHRQRTPIALARDDR